MQNDRKKNMEVAITEELRLSFIFLHVSYRLQSTNSSCQIAITERYQLRSLRLLMFALL